jgi:hypothetical protein
MPWAPDYVTLPEMKSYLRLTGTADDVELALDITAASRAVDSTTYRQFGQVAAAEARIYTARWSDTLCRWVIVVDDLMDQTGLTVAIAAGPITLYTLNPANAAQRARPWTRIVVSDVSTVKPKGEAGEVTVTGKWGWTAVPDTVKLATKLQSSRFFKRRDAPFGIAGSPDTGSEMRLLAKVDPDLAVALKPYIRWLRVRQTVG